MSDLDRRILTNCLVADFCLVNSSHPAGEMKDNQNVSSFHRARAKFPLEQCHHRAGVELAMTGCSEDLHFVGHSGFVIYDQAVNALALITEMLCFDWVLRIRRRHRILFVLGVDSDNLGGMARR